MKIRSTITFCILLFISSVAFSQTNPPLKTAWEPWFPYEYLKIQSLQSSLTGLDVELVRQFAEQANQHLLFKEISWNDTLLALKRGDIDLASGATYSDARAQYVYFSQPYRFEEDSLFVPRSKNKIYHFKTAEQLLAYIPQHHFRLGINNGSILADVRMNQFIHDPANAKYIVPVKDEQQGMTMLLENEIDGYMCDRIIGSTLIWEARVHDKLAEHYLHMRTPIHLIFSKKSVSPDTVQAFDNAIAAIRHQTIYRNDFSWYLYPVIMMQATGQAWFKMLDVLGVIFFSISGVLIAYSLNQTILAAFVYAMLPSMTGGILRDVILGHRPVEALETPNYLLLVCSVVFSGYILITLLNKIMQYEEIRHTYRTIHHIFSFVQKCLQQLLTICDALGLATLSVSGVMISLMAKASPLWLWGPFFAFMTACFGTIIRDIISHKEHLEDVVGEINSEVAIGWSLIFSIALIFNVENIQPDLVRNLVLFTVTGGFLTRLLVHYLKVPNVYFK